MRMHRTSSTDEGMMKKFPEPLQKWITVTMNNSYNNNNNNNTFTRPPTNTSAIVAPPTNALSIERSHTVMDRWLGRLRSRVGFRSVIHSWRPVRLNEHSRTRRFPISYVGHRCLLFPLVHFAHLVHLVHLAIPATVALPTGPPTAVSAQVPRGNQSHPNPTTRVTNEPPCRI